MASPATDLIALDTLGKLRAHGHGLGGNCRSCRRHYGVPGNASERKFIKCRIGKYSSGNSFFPQAAHLRSIVE
jgi:hypothetical protein